MHFGPGRGPDVLAEREHVMSRCHLLAKRQSLFSISTSSYFPHLRPLARLISTTGIVSLLVVQETEFASN